MNKKSNSLKSFEKGQDKVNDFKIQLQKVYEAFMAKSMTMLEAEYYCGVMRSNICYHIHTLLKQNRIALIRRRKCSITGFVAGEYTADPNLFPLSNQLELFS